MFWESKKCTPTYYKLDVIRIRINSAGPELVFLKFVLEIIISIAFSVLNESQWFKQAKCLGSFHAL